MSTIQTKQVFVYLPYNCDLNKEIEILKRKGAKYDKFTKTWYFNIDVRESLNNHCRGYKIKKVVNPPSFEEVLANKHIVLQNYDDPFDDDFADRCSASCPAIGKTAGLSLSRNQSDNETPVTENNTTVNSNNISITNFTNKLKELKALMDKCEMIIDELIR